MFYLSAAIKCASLPPPPQKYSLDKILFHFSRSQNIFWNWYCLKYISKSKYIIIEISATCGQGLTSILINLRYRIWGA